VKKPAAEAICESKYYVFYMPDRVDSKVLTAALRDGLHASSLPWVLDFSATVHIHYGAFRRFAARLRRVRSGGRPVLLAGLNPYCGLIIHYALRAADWEAFTEGTTDFSWAVEAPRGNGASRAPLFDEPGFCRTVGEDSRFFPPPCVN
jgi:hypothetical protein